MLEFIAANPQMLDTGYYMLVKYPVFSGIFRNAQIVHSKNVQYPETSIQDQPVLAMVFVVAIQLEQELFCNYGGYFGKNRIRQNRR